MQEKLDKRHLITGNYAVTAEIKLKQAETKSSRDKAWHVLMLLC